MVSIEKSAYLHPKKAAISSSNKAATRLASCADTFRLAAEFAASRIKPKTATAVIDHIIHILPASGQSFCQPLRDDYLRSLRVILECPSHGEHLRQKLWLSVVDFLVDGIHQHTGEDGTNNYGGKGRTDSQDSRNGRHLSVHISQSSGAKSNRTDASSSAIDELVLSLSLVTAITHAPLMSRALSITDCILEYLSSTARPQHPSLEALNNVLFKAVTEDMSLARSVIFRLIPIIRRIWPIKSAAAKDQMQISLLIGKELLLDHTGPTIISQDNLSSLTNLYDVMVNEYHRRNGRDILHVEDVSFALESPMSLYGLELLAPKASDPRAMSNWTVVSIIASLALALDSAHNQAASDRATDEIPNKRQKLASCMEEIFCQARTSKSMERLTAIQVLPFLLHESSLAYAMFAAQLPDFANLVLEDDAAVASWMMIAISRSDLPSALCRYIDVYP